MPAPQSKPADTRSYADNDIAYFGAQIANVTPELARKLGLKTPSGAHLVAISEGAPADKGGARNGDVVLKVGGADIADMAAFLKELEGIKPGSDIELTVRRGSDEKVLAIRLGGFLGDNLPAAEDGDVGAMRRVALLYLSGRLGETNLVKAESWYRKAAAAGDKTSLNALARRYWSGNQVAEDRKKAVQFFQESANQGSANSMISLARINYEGLIGAKNKNEARRYYEMAAEQGNVEAMRWVANMLEEGEGGPKDQNAAHRWYLKAAKAGDRVAMYNVGVNFHTGKATAQNHAKAVYWYERSLAKNYNGALFNLSLLYYNKLGVSRDRAKAAELVYRALKLGDKHAVDQMTRNGSSWDKAFRRRIQELMWRDGAYDGPLDGSFGPKTKQAILALVNRSQSDDRQPVAAAREGSPASAFDLGGSDDLGSLD